MLGVTLRFPAGRYHATPWGRHVNEADIAWPPEPWRLLRALVAVWHRKADRERFPEALLGRLVERLADELPHYRLPRHVHAHTRHYMPVNEGRKETRSLVFDAFARVSPEDPLIVAWPTLQLAPDLVELLDHLLARLGYLGRAESWVTAERAGEEECRRLDCRPLGAGEGGGDGETLTLLAPLTPAAYASARAAGATSAEGARASSRRRPAALPASFLDLLRMETGDLHKARWSRPPGTRLVPYLRPAEHRRLARAARRPAPAGSLTTARYALVGKPLPRIEDAVRIGEALRLALISAADRAGRGAPIPQVLSGHGESPATGHRHAFFLPEDADDDGHVDHLVVHAASGLTDSLPALAALQRLWLDHDQEWQVLLEGVTSAAAMASASRLLRQASLWQSVTPYLHPWHLKKNLSVEAQIARELALRAGLPPLRRLERLPAVLIHGRERRPVHFHRFRSKRGLLQPDRQGSFWRVELEEPIEGPLALGFGCHYGLGMFQPAESPPAD